MKRENTAFRDRSVYPQSQIFKPTVLRMSLYAVAPMMRRLKELLYPEAPPTREERRQSYPPKFTSVNHSADDLDPKEWRKVGCHWVRISEGEYHQCHSTEREGAYVLWRDAHNSYCCAGFPYYKPEQIARMQKTMEVFKPVLRIEVEGCSPILISLARSIADPQGNCWGMSTCKMWMELNVDGKNMRHGKEGEQLTIAGVEKCLKALNKKEHAENT